MTGFSCDYISYFSFPSVESGTNAKQKRRYTSTVSKDVVAMYNRLVEVMDTLALLVDKQSLTDITILKVLLYCITCVCIIECGVCFSYLPLVYCPSLLRISATYS